MQSKTTATKKRPDFQAFMGVVAEIPEGKDIHVILDNYSTHKKYRDWLTDTKGNKIERAKGLLSRSRFSSR